MRTLHVGNLVRPATPPEISALRTRKSFSPAAVEEAILSLHGMVDWNPAYDAMKAAAPSPGLIEPAVLTG